MFNISTIELKRIKTILLFSLIGIIVGPVYAILTFGYAPFRILKGAIIGFLIMSASSAFEVFWFNDKLKKFSFSFVVVIRSLFYIIVISFAIISVVAYHESIVHQISLIEYLSSYMFLDFLLRGDFPQIFIFAIIASFTINFLWQISRLIGIKSLTRYLTGKYHYPKEEERIFMFLDLKASTSIAEKLGHLNFHKLLNDFFYDITESVIKWKGEIYQYVGDEVVISWPAVKGSEKMNCINCYFDMVEKINSRKNIYQRKFNMVPEFKAGIHYGIVVTGEIGDIKKDIVYHGDVLNTCSRIQSSCNELNKRILISGELLSRLKLNGQYIPEKIGSVKLRGKENDIELYSLSLAK